MTVRKVNNGKYRAYRVWIGYKNEETRWATKTLANDYMIRNGGYLMWEDFESKAEAEAFIAERAGRRYW